jgi:hypothetical protein
MTSLVVGRDCPFPLPEVFVGAYFWIRFKKKKTDRIREIIEKPSSARKKKRLWSNTLFVRKKGHI